jgi:large subunit ribosomal protein L32
MAPLPKRRRSKSKQRSRQAHWAIKPVNLSECSQCHSPKLSHRVCHVCGTYNGREVIKVETE